MFVKWKNVTTCKWAVYLNNKMYIYNKRLLKESKWHYLQRKNDWWKIELLNSSNSITQSKRMWAGMTLRLTKK